VLKLERYMAQSTSRKSLDILALWEYHPLSDNFQTASSSDAVRLHVFVKERGKVPKFLNSGLEVIA
jgi:hypothetical protein